MTKWQKGITMSWLLTQPLFSKSGGATVNAAYIKKPLAKPKGPGCHPRTGFCTGRMPWSLLSPQSSSSNRGESIKMIRHLSYLPGKPIPADFFSLPEGKVGVGRPLADLGELQGEFTGSFRQCMDHCKKHVPIGCDEA
jgi:hypothetical protein